MKIEIDKQELNTILAALRTYQEAGYGEPCNRPLHIHDIAVDGDEISMDDEGISALCIKLNCPEPPYEQIILWGECPDPESDAIRYTFETGPELDAFLHGIREMDGWMGWEECVSIGDSVIVSDRSERRHKIRDDERYPRSKS